MLPITTTLRFQPSALPAGVAQPADVILDAAPPETGDRVHLKQSQVPTLSEQANLVAANVLSSATDSLGEHWRHVMVGPVIHEYTNTDHFATVYVSWPADVTEETPPAAV